MNLPYCYPDRPMWSSVAVVLRTGCWSANGFVPAARSITLRRCAPPGDREGLEELASRLSIY